MVERAGPMSSRDIDFDRPVTDRTRTASTTETESDPEVIAREIDQTRSEMTDTVDAIQDRLDPERISQEAVEAATDVTVQARDAAIEVTDHAISEAKSAVRELASQAKTTVRDSTVGRAEQMAMQTRDSAQVAGNDLITTIRENPIPAAMAAVGIGWLWKQRSNGQSKAYSHSYGGYPAYPAYAWQEGNQSGASGKNIAGQAQQMAGQAAHQAQHMAGQTQEMTENITDQTQRMAGEMQHKAQSAFEGMSGNPLMMGAIGIALGAAAAMLLPESEQERQILGEAREQMMDRVQQIGGETAQRVQHAATETGKAAMREAMGSGGSQGTHSSDSPA